MSKKIEILVHFDVNSLFSYVGLNILRRYATSVWSDKIQVSLVPASLGHVFKATGNGPPMAIPAKGKYMQSDFARVTKWASLPCNKPLKSPIETNTTKALRLLSAIKVHHPKCLWDAVTACFAAYWVKQLDITSLEVLQKVLETDCGFENAEAKRMIEESEGAEVKQLFRANTDKAIEIGLFGFPAFVIKRSDMPSDKMEGIPKSDSEYEFFFGSDRLPVMAYYLNLPWFGPMPSKSAQFKSNL